MKTTRTDRFKAAREDAESRRSSGMRLLTMLNKGSVGNYDADNGLNVRSPVSRHRPAGPASGKLLPYSPPCILANKWSLWLRRPCDSVYWQPEGRS
jgi:hypothetical protein